ncbi:MAG: PAS domain S-box protein, partial [Magnetovibrio sp.]|nr:PAS domain S-box protein [Magnetovibrio sp.]
MALDLIKSAALLLSLCVLQGFNTQLWQEHKTTAKVISGALFGGICIVGMLMPIEVSPGIGFDARSVVLSMSGLFGGPLVALISTSIVAGYRIWIGGGGVPVDVAVIITSSSLGLIYWSLRRNHAFKVGVPHLFAFGIFVQAIVVLMFTQLPEAIAQTVMDDMALPFMLSFAPATALLGTFLNDIEERTKTDHLLKLSKARLSHHIENTPLGAITWNDTFRCTEWNKAAEKMFGYTSKEAIGKSGADLIILPKYKLEIQDRFLEIMDQDGGTHAINDNITKYGKTITCDWYNTPIVNDNGIVIGITSLVHDITDRMEAEKALVQSEAKFRSIYQSTTVVAIITIDETNIITTWNTGAKHIFGYEENEIIGGPMLSLLAKRYRKDHISGITRVLRGENYHPSGTSLEMRGLNKNGHEFPLELSIGVWKSGKETFFSIIIVDITQRKHAQDQLIQSAKMATIGEMASGITHELNQPMNIIRMGIEYEQILIQRGETNLDQIAKTLRKTEQQILRMSDIITHMRAFSRIENAGQSAFDAVQAAVDSCKLFNAQVSGVDIQFKSKIPNENILVIGHAIRLEQVILNLLSNALDAVVSQHRTGHEETEALVQMALFTDPNHKNVIITVEDTGGGIADEVMPHIFNPFVTTKDTGQGTGLGLSVSCGIVENMKGSITVSNHAFKDQRGARFTITLPIATQPAETDIHAPPSAQPPLFHAHDKLNDITVLVVDDELEAAHSLSDFLQRMGYCVSTAYNGEEALLLFESD